jgi:hypothetical protein
MTAEDSEPPGTFFSDGSVWEDGSGGWIRTNDQRINSPLRYRCATPDQPVGGAYNRPLAPKEAPVAGLEVRGGIEPP